MVGANHNSLMDASAAAAQQSQQPGPSSTPASPAHASANARDRINRRLIGQATATICQTLGFESIQSSALEVLCFMAHKFMDNVCRNSREYCEHTGRSMVTPSDVFMGMLNSGMDIQGFPEFLESTRHARTQPIAVKCQSPVKSPPVLRIAEPRPHPSHFPNFLPPFPDPHTYIHTEVKDDIDSNYEKVRRLNAQNRRDMENSLVTFALSVYPSTCVFQELAKRLQFEAKDVLAKKERELTVDDSPDNETKPERTNGEISASELENGNGEEEAGGMRSVDSTKQNQNNNNGFLGKDGAASGGSAQGGPPSTTQDLLFSEEQFRLRETEHSYVLKRIPPFCHILLPFEEPKPYVSALVTDDIDVEEEHNYFAKILSKEMEEDLADNDDDEPMEIGG